MYSLLPNILGIQMDVSRCILVLDTSILMTSNSGRREYLVQTRNKVRVGEFSMYIGLGTNKKERGESSTDWSSNRSRGRKGKYRGNDVHSGMTRTRFAIHA